MKKYCMGGITFNVSSDIPLTELTFENKFIYFHTDAPGKDNVYINHHVGFPFKTVEHLGEQVYYRSPWGIYKKNDSWIYIISPDLPKDNSWVDMAIFNTDYSVGHFYHKNIETITTGNWHSLTFFPTDQILIAQLLADREGLYLHSGAVILDGAGLMFIGHSSAGKSTTMNMLKNRAEILCDDRNIVRQHQDGFYVYGTWSHGDVSLVSPASAPLNAIFFIRQSEKNRITPLKDKREISTKLLACLIKPFLTAEWWDKVLPLIEKIADQVPCYEMEFDKSGKIVPQLEKLVAGVDPR